MAFVSLSPASLASLAGCAKTRICLAKRSPNRNPTIENREAKFRYELGQKFECGIELVGTEIKSVREGQLNLKDSYCNVKQGELWLRNANIAVYRQSSAYFNHDPTRERRLLLHKRDIAKLKRTSEQQSMTIVPTKAYFSGRGWLKVEVALAKGKTMGDKRETIKKRDDERNIKRVLKDAL